jgi:pyruvate dehydrogenase E2 component (dihydrolipoamide acetyltransferase)
MAYEFRLPDIGEGVVEGEIVKWKVKEGQVLTQDQPMVEVMTDKATVEIPAPRPGKVERILVGEGKICKVGEVMIVIDDGSAAKTSTAKAEPKAAPQPAPPPTPSRGNGRSATPVSERVLAAPSTRRLARQMGVDLGTVTPTGRNGRVTSEDVRGAGQAPSGRPAAPSGGEERIPFRGVRKAIAQNLVRSKFTATHFTYVEEVDMTEMVQLRTRAKDKAAERGVKLSYLPFIIKAVIHGLRKYPSINSSLDEAKEEIVWKRYYHLGIATQGPQGLSVGVVRDADRRSLFDLGREIERIAEAIRAGKATREELTGSTFTISSLGQLGGVLATPIINFPEAAILGVHKIAERPAVVNGQIAIRHLMNLSISVDHRIADGYDAAMFVQEVKAYLEDPTLLFLEMV